MPDTTSTRARAHLAIIADDELRRRDYLAAIDRALPEDDIDTDELESFDRQDRFTELMAWVIGTAVLLALFAVIAFGVGVATK